VRADEDRAQYEQEGINRDPAGKLRAFGVAESFGHRQEDGSAAHRVDDREQRREDEERLLDQYTPAEVLE
jgi:hypothetical protein